MVGVEEFEGEALAHLFFGALACVEDEPAQGEGGAALGADLDGDLVGGTTDAAAFDFDGGADVIDGLFEDREDVVLFVLQALFDGVECVVEDAFGDALCL